MKSIVLALALFGGATCVHAAGAGGAHMHHTESIAAKPDRNQAHKAVGVVKKVDASSAKVTLAHEPVKSLNWPSMTMAFVVKDKTLLGKLAEGKKVEVDFQQQGKDYVITAVK